MLNKKSITELNYEEISNNFDIKPGEVDVAMC